MSEQANYVCQYCHKVFSNQYVLKTHQTTAKYCIEIQNKQNENNPVEIDLYNCEYCNISFTLKSSLQKHLITCKQKKTLEENKKNSELTEELEQYKTNITTFSKQIEHLTLQLAEKERVLLEKEKIVQEKERLLSEKNVRLEEKDRQIEKLYTTIKEKDEYIQNNTNVTNVYNNNNTYNSVQYNLTLQAEFDKLTPFTVENVKNKVTNIKPISLIEFNNYNLMLNFCSNVGRSLSDMAIVTDKSRGLLIVKTKDGEKQKYQSKSFVHDALIMAEPECKQLLNQTNTTLVRLELDQNIMPEDQARAHNDLILLHYYLTNKTMDTTVQGISNIMVNHCVYVTKRLANQSDVGNPPKITVEEQ